MTVTPPSSPAQTFLRLALVLLLAGTAAYWNSFGGIFLLDDEYTITDNVDIDNWKKAFQGPKGAPSSGRPLTSFSFTANFKLGEFLGLPNGGRNSSVYHATNLLIHLGTGLTLFAFLGNTLRRVPAFAGRALLLSFMTALLWTLHPMNTSAVTYMSQRAESVMALFFLLCFWACERAARSPRYDDWYAAATAFAILAAMGKENAVALSFLVPLYDRAFLYSTWRETWQRRRVLYGLLLIPWAFVLWIQFTDPRGGTVLLQYQVINPFTYLYTQSVGILMYLRKVFWPYPIILDYGWPIILTFSACWAAFLTLSALVIGTVVACVRWPRVGFAGAWLFIILGPSSSVIPIITEILAEHRMYLPMMSVLALLVCGLDYLQRPRHMTIRSACVWMLASGVLSVFGRSEFAITVFGFEPTVQFCFKAMIPLVWLAVILRFSSTRVRNPDAVLIALAAVAAVALAGRTQFQNTLYANAVDMWEYNAKHTPDNRRVWYNVCVKSRVDRKDFKRAEEAGLRALQISPDYPDAHMQMAIIYKETNRLVEAERSASTAVQLESDKGYHYSLLAEILIQAEKWDAARAVLAEGLKRDEQSQECMMTTIKLQMMRDGLDVAIRQASVWMRLPVTSPKILEKLLFLAESKEQPLPEAAAEIRRRQGKQQPPAK